MLTCTTCGEPATHLWAALDPKTFQVSSINGLGHLSPSCDGCGGDADAEEWITIRVPLATVSFPEDDDDGGLLGTDTRDREGREDVDDEKQGGYTTPRQCPYCEFRTVSREMFWSHIAGHDV